MEKKKIIKLSKMFSKWSLSYVLISLLAIIVIAICSVRFTKEMEEELEYANAVQLEMTQLQMDNSIYGLRNFCSLAGLNKTVIGLQQEFDYEKVARYQLYELVKQLKSEKLMGDWADNCFLYFPALDLLVSEQSYDTSKEYFDVYLNAYGFSYELMYEVINKESPATRILPLDTGDDSSLVLVVKSMNVYRNNPGVNAVMILDLKELLHSSKWLDAERDQICIIDRTYKCMVSNADITPEMEQYLMELSLNDREQAVSNQQKIGDSIISFISSEFENWDYVVFTQEKETTKNVVEVQRLVIMLMLAYLLISGIIIGDAAMRQYQPLKDIMEVLEGQGAANEENAGDTYEYISKSINQMIDKNKESTNVINKQKNAISREMFHRLLTEKDFYAVTQGAALHQYGIGVEEHFCYVLAYRLEEESTEKNNPSMPREIAQFILQNVTTENVNSLEMECISFPEGNCEQVFLIWGEMSEDEMRGAIRQVYEKTQEFFVQYFKETYRIALSELHFGADEVYTAYQEVLRVFDYQKKERNEELISYGDINLLPMDTLLKYPIDIENQLTHSVSQGNIEEAHKHIRFLLEQNQVNCLAPEAMQFLVSNIASSIIRVVVKITKEEGISQAQKNLMEACKRLDINRMQEELLALAADACQQIAEFSKKDKENQKGRLYGEVKAYIEQNYADVELSVNYIAEYFAIPPTTLSKLFKELDGENVSVYIHKVRLEHVKKLLGEGVRLEEIVAKCGFGSQRTFLRVFKQYEGVTPTQYKELLEKKRNEA